MINEDLKGLAVPMTLLKLDADNARKHSEANIEAIRRSLEMFGQQKPIVILETGVIIAGNGTYLAAKKLGWTELAVNKFKDETKAKAYAIADNKTADLAEWDMDQLADTLGSLKIDGYDLEKDFGFTDTEIKGMLGEFAPGTEDEQGKLDEKKMIQCPNCAHEFTN